MPTLAESVAEEIFATIERERRINKDDLVLAVERATATFEVQEDAARQARMDKMFKAAREAGFPISTAPGSINVADTTRAVDPEHRKLSDYYKIPPSADLTIFTTRKISSKEARELFERSGMKYITTIPKGAKTRPHPSGDGWLVAHPDYPLRWIKSDGTVEDITAPT